jgi:glycosyltransferase involved in cell wall biosynthesis
MPYTVRHVTPGLGVLPRDPEVEACSGLVGVALGTAQAQADSGHSVQVFGWNPTPGVSKWRIGPIEAYGTRGWSRAKLGGYDFRVTAPLLAMSLWYGTPDVVHAYTDPHLLLGQTRSKRFLHFQTPIPEQPSWTYTRLVNQADAIICCGEFIKNQFLKRVDFPEDRVFEVNNGIRLERFENVSGARLRQEWEIDQSAKVVLFAGALVPEKGLLYLLRAARKLDNATEIEIVVAGSSELWLTPEHAASSQESQYVQQVREAAAGLNIRWLGSVPLNAMPSVYAASDICVVPSAWDDPFPLVACEAMAAGKPVIASRRGGLSQIVVEGETGLLVQSEDSSALHCALESLLNDSERVVRLGNQARERSRQFSWSRIADKLDDIYGQLPARRSVRDFRQASSKADHTADNANPSGEIS